MKFNQSKLKVIQKAKGNNCKFPKEMSEELAELVGIHFGDGSLYETKKFNYHITYDGNLQKDKKYMKFLSFLLFKLFNVKFKRLFDLKKNSISLRTRCKKLFIFYKNHLLIPDGTKRNLSIPTYIEKNSLFLIAFIRGLFDTDGCITIQQWSKYSYPLIRICTKHKAFAKQIANSLVLLGIPSFITFKKDSHNHRCYDVTVRNKNVKKFFDIVGSNNPRNIEKFKKLKWV